MNPQALSTPLSLQEISELEALLDSEAFRGEAMLPDELQGLFFAVASGPDPGAGSVSRLDASAGQTAGYGARYIGPEGADRSGAARRDGRAGDGRARRGSSAGGTRHGGRSAYRGGAGRAPRSREQ